MSACGDGKCREAPRRSSFFERPTSKQLVCPCGDLSACERHGRSRRRGARATTQTRRSSPASAHSHTRRKTLEIERGAVFFCFTVNFTSQKTLAAQLYDPRLEMPKAHLSWAFLWLELHSSACTASTVGFSQFLHGEAHRGRHQGNSFSLPFARHVLVRSINQNCLRLASRTSSASTAARRATCSAPSCGGWLRAERALIMIGLCGAVARSCHRQVGLSLHDPSQVRRPGARRTPKLRAEFLRRADEI